MWMWSDKERFEKLIRTVQKWMEFQSNNNLLIDESVAERAYMMSEKYSGEILEPFGLQDKEASTFLQRWIQLALFCGYLSGWKHTDIPADQIDKSAKEFAASSTNQIFEMLLTDPVSPLVMGLNPHLIRLLKACHESALYAGFRQGAQDSQQIRSQRQNPFDIHGIFS